MYIKNTMTYHNFETPPSIFASTSTWGSLGHQSWWTHTASHGTVFQLGPSFADFLRPAEDSAGLRGGTCMPPNSLELVGFQQKTNTI